MPSTYQYKRTSLEESKQTSADSSADATLSRQSRQADLYGAASSGYGSYCPEGIPVEQAIFAILAAFGVAFGVLYRAITMGRRRRRRRGRRGTKARRKKSTMYSTTWYRRTREWRRRPPPRDTRPQRSRRREPRLRR